MEADRIEHGHYGNRVDSDFLVAPDSTSRYIILQPAALTTVSSAPVSNSDPLASIAIEVPVANLLNQPLAAVSYAVNVRGKAFNTWHRFREIYLFGGDGATSSFQGGINLTVDGTLAIGSDQAPQAALNEDATAVSVVASVKQAPDGDDITVAIYVGGVLWITLTIPDGATEVEADTSMIAGAATITAGSNIRLDITGVGTTFPRSFIPADHRC